MSNLKFVWIGTLYKMGIEKFQEICAMEVNFFFTKGVDLGA
jgi:hypothetical protein